MGIEVDWSKAPEGATHYVPETMYYRAAWYKKVGDDWMYFIPGEVNGWSLAWKLSSNAIARPVDWDGTGLPPVGIVCEHKGFTKDGPPWFNVLVLAHAKVDDRYVAVFQRVDDEMHISFSEAVLFRPIRTPEQIAAEKREREINDLVETIVCHYEYPKGAESYIGLARALHNAGYRKTEQEKDNV